VGAKLHKSGTGAARGSCFTVVSDPKLELEVKDEVLLGVVVGWRRTRDALCGGAFDVGEAVTDEDEDGVRGRLAGVEAIYVLSTENIQILQ